MNLPSALTQNRSGSLKPDEFLPLSRPGSEAPVNPRRKNRDPSWWNNPSPTKESLADHFKAKKEDIDLKSNATLMAHAPLIEESETPNPAEETLSIDTCLSITQCDEAPKKLTNVPVEIQIASVTLTKSDESDEHEESAAARDYVPSSPTRRNWKKPGQEESPAASPTRSSWKPDDFLPLERPASPMRKSNQAAKATGILDIVAPTTVAPVILVKPDAILPLRSSPTSPMTRRKPRQAAKETVVVNTNENHAETEEKVQTTVARSTVADIDDPVTNYWNCSCKPDAFQPLRRHRNAPFSGRPSFDFKLHTAKASREHPSFPVEVQIDCFDTEALDCSGIDDAAIGNEAVCAEELVENQSLAGKLHPSINSLDHSSVEWGNRELKATGKADVLNSDIEWQKPDIEWKKPDWTKCRELKATGKADVLNSAGNLARPISLPVGSDARIETVTNIADEIRSRITQPFAARREFY
jgi:hypothetical protein